MRTNLLVVTNQTADAPELLDHLQKRMQMGTCRVTLVLPSSWREREEARERADAAVAQLREIGVEADAVLGDSDPCIAVQEAWDPRRYDEVLVVTLPGGSSKWMAQGLPHRIARLTDATVHHLEARPRAVAEATPLPPKERDPLLVGVLGQMRATTRRPDER